MTDFLNQFQTNGVVSEVDVGVPDAFFLILRGERHAKYDTLVCNTSYNLLFQGKYIMVEEFVQFLVCVVDAELLKRVDLHNKH